MDSLHCNVFIDIVIIDWYCDADMNMLLSLSVSLLEGLIDVNVMIMYNIHYRYEGPQLLQLKVCYGTRLLFIVVVVILFPFFLKNIEVYPDTHDFACAAVSLLMHKTINTF